MQRRPANYSQSLNSWVIPLTRGVVAMVDEDVATLIGNVAWYADAPTGIWIAARSVYAEGGKSTVLMHREIMKAPDGMLVDHISHPPFQEKTIDNRRDNLRLCSDYGNARNARRRTDAPTQYKGITWCKRTSKWVAKINHNHKRIYLGSFGNPEDAATAYDVAAIQLHGQFALTNAQSCRTSLGS